MKGPSIAIPSRSPRQVIHRSWTHSKPPKSSTSKPLNREISKFRIRVVELQDENDLLRSTLTAFSTIQNPGSVDFLLEQFRSEIAEFSKRLDERSTMIGSVSKKLGKTKPATIDGTENQQEQKKILMAENQKLVARALYLEKQMIAAKLRLRLNHDHRDFCRLKRQLARLAQNDNTGNEEEEEINRNRRIISNLKQAIEHERQRIVQLELPPTREEDAAELIQRYWRGFNCRQKTGKPWKEKRDDDSDVIPHGETFPELSRTDDEDEEEDGRRNDYGSEQENISNMSVASDGEKQTDDGARYEDNETNDGAGEEENQKDDVERDEDNEANEGAGEEENEANDGARDEDNEANDGASEDENEKDDEAGDEDNETNEGGGEEENEANDAAGEDENQKDDAAGDEDNETNDEAGEENNEKDDVAGEEEGQEDDAGDEDNETDDTTGDDEM